MDTFNFVLDPNDYTCENKDTFKVVIENIENKVDLFNKLSELLEFPDYFGSNWDALYDCLNDLSWIAEKHILLIHSKTFHLESELNIYIDVILSVSKNWQEDETHVLKTIFPLQQKDIIISILKE